MSCRSQDELFSGTSRFIGKSSMQSTYHGRPLTKLGGYVPAPSPVRVQSGLVDRHDLRRGMAITTDTNKNLAAFKVRTAQYL